MYKKNKISVFVPAFNEENFITKTLNTIPAYVDLIVVVNDNSKDKTKEKIIACAKKDKRIVLIDQKINGGIGNSAMLAHAYSALKKCDILALMAGDNQMDPRYLSMLLNEIIVNNYDYAKGNRFFHQKDLKSMPKMRNIGNIFVTFITKFSTGYWSISDPLNGYTALRVEAFTKLNPEDIASRFDFEVSMLLELSLLNARVKDVFIPAQYGNEESDINYIIDSWRVLRTLIKGYIKRIIYKYTLFNFYPISLFYLSGYFLILIGLLFGGYVTFFSLILKHVATPATVMLSVVPFTLGFQLILQAIVLDIQNEPK